jgi:hypothetical protein
MKMKMRFASVDRRGKITTFTLTQRTIATISSRTFKRYGTEIPAPD